MILWQPYGRGILISRISNKDARKWFGDKYSFLIRQGIEGFWNDMNEPAIFYSSEGMEEAKKLAGEFSQDKDGKDPHLENAGRAKRTRKQPRRLPQILS